MSLLLEQGSEQVFTYIGSVPAQSSIASGYSKTKAYVGVTALASTIVAAWSRTLVPGAVYAGQSTVAALVSKTKVPVVGIAGQTTVTAQVARTRVVNGEVAALSTVQSATSFGQTFVVAGEIVALSGVQSATAFEAAVAVPVGGGGAHRFAYPRYRDVEYVYWAPANIYVGRARLTANAQFKPVVVRVVQAQVMAAGKSLASPQARTRAPIVEARGTAGVAAKTWVKPTVHESAGAVATKGVGVQAQTHYEDWLVKVRAWDDELLEMAA